MAVLGGVIVHKFLRNLRNFPVSTDITLSVGVHRVSRRSLTQPPLAILVWAQQEVRVGEGIVKAERMFASCVGTCVGRNTGITRGEANSSISPEYLAPRKNG